MNIPRVQAKLAGYDGPFFPEGIDELNRLFSHNGRWNGSSLEAAAKFIAGYQMQKCTAETEDGYRWFWDIWFKNGKGVVRVLFPWADAGIGDEKSKPHRSIAVYTKGEVKQEVVDHIVRMFIKRLGFHLKVELPALERTSKT